MTLPPPRAFVTCSSRARGSIESLLERVERALLDLGWRTRIPVVASREHDLAVRRKLGRQNKEQAGRSTCVLHLLAPAHLEGRRLGRVLSHVTRVGVPLLLLRGDDTRERLGIAPPRPERVQALLRLTGASLVERLADLPDALARFGRVGPPSLDDPSAAPRVDGPR